MTPEPRVVCCWTCGAEAGVTPVRQQVRVHYCPHNKDCRELELAPRSDGGYRVMTVVSPMGGCWWCLASAMWRRGVGPEGLLDQVKALYARARAAARRQHG